MTDLKCFLNEIIDKNPVKFELQAFLEQALLSLDPEDVVLNPRNLRKTLRIVAEEMAVEMEPHSMDKKEIYDFKFKRSLEAISLIERKALEEGILIEEGEAKKEVQRVFGQVGLRIPQPTPVTQNP